MTMTISEAIGVALAARWTGGLVDPTVGEAIAALGCDRGFAAIDPDLPAPPGRAAAVPGWQAVSLARHPGGAR